MLAGLVSSPELAPVESTPPMLELTSEPRSHVVVTETVAESV